MITLTRDVFPDQSTSLLVTPQRISRFLMGVVECLPVVLSLSFVTVSGPRGELKMSRQSDQTRVVEVELGSEGQPTVKHSLSLSLSLFLWPSLGWPALR